MQSFSRWIVYRKHRSHLPESCRRTEVVSTGGGALDADPSSTSSSSSSDSQDVRRCQGTRASQVSHSSQLAALYMPTIALAFQKELSTFFLKPVRRALPTPIDTLIYSTLFYQIHCSSYFAKWCRKGGEDFRAFLKFMWKYVCQLTDDDVVSLSPTSSLPSLPRLL